MKRRTAIIALFFSVSLFMTNTCGLLAGEVDPGIYLAARSEIKSILMNLDSFEGGEFGIDDSTLIQKAELGKAIRVFHKLDLSQVVASNPEELLEKGVLVRYEVPILIEGVPWISVYIHPTPNHDGKYDCFGAREAGATYLCYETLSVVDSVTSIAIDYFIFRDRSGPPIVHIALLELNDTYFLAPLNNPAARALCGPDCDFRSMPLIEYCKAVEFYRQ